MLCFPLVDPDGKKRESEAANTGKKMRILIYHASE
jgi:hypothetical protein